MEPYSIEGDQQFLNLSKKISEIDKNMILQGFHKDSNQFIKISRSSSEDFPVTFLPNVYSIVQKLNEAKLLKVSIFSYNGEEIEYSCFPSDTETIEKIISIYITSRLNSYQMCVGLQSPKDQILETMLIEKYGNKIYFRSKECSRLIIGSSLCAKCESLMIKSEFTEITEKTEVDNEEELFCDNIKEEVEEDCNEDGDYKGFDTKGELLMMEDSSFKDDSLKENHLDASVTCDLCGKVVKNNRLLTRHKKQAHGDTSNDLDSRKCKYCNKVFSADRNLIKHIQNIHEVQIVTCHICGKLCKSKYYLTEHIRNAHYDKSQDGTYVKRFKCDVPGCDSAYTAKRPLMAHISAVHKKEFLYTCSTCGKKFNHRSALSLHENAHNGKFRFECDLCDKKFQSKNAFEGHRRSHTGEKPFSCPICNIKMSRPDKIKEHIKVVHKITWQEAELKTNSKIAEKGQY